MAVPLKYNWRNLLVRRVSSLMTVLGIALVVTVFLLVMALAEGVRLTFQSAIPARDLVVMRVGSQADVMSFVSRAESETIRTLPGVERAADGSPLVSPELVVLINTTRRDGKRTNLIVRGVEPAALTLRPGLRIVEGRMFRPGTNEAIVSSRLRRRFPNMEPGQTLSAGSQRWVVAGVFDAGDTPYDSEIWADLRDVQAQSDRGTGVSVVRVRGTDKTARDRLIAAVKGDQRLKLEARSEQDYFTAQMTTAGPIQFLAWFVGVVMAVGASFGAMNTMYAQVTARIREIGTLRALGFSRGSILVSFVVESVVLALAGGLLGIGISLAAVHFVLTAPTGTQNFTTFAEILFNFRLTPPLLLTGIVFSLAMGVFGGLFPAARAARTRITTALREA